LIRIFKNTISNKSAKSCMMQFIATRHKCVNLKKPKPKVRNRTPFSPQLIYFHTGKIHFLSTANILLMGRIWRVFTFLLSNSGAYRFAIRGKGVVNVGVREIVWTCCFWCLGKPSKNPFNFDSQISDTFERSSDWIHSFARRSFRLERKETYLFIYLFIYFYTLYFISLLFFFSFFPSFVLQ